MKSLCLVCPDAHAPGYYRAVLPHRHCREALEERGIKLVLCTDWPNPGDHDAYVFYRSVTPHAWSVVTKLVISGKRVFWDLDDNFFDLPKWSSHFERFDAFQRSILLQSLHQADGVSVSTEALAEATRARTESRIVVLPNLLDAADYPLDTRPRSGPVRVMYQGWSNHSRDVEQFIPAIQSVAKRFGDSVEFLFAGYCPPELREDPAVKPIIVAGWDVRSHGRMLCALRPDIGLAALSTDPEDAKFNDCISPNKVLEYVMAGARPIANLCVAYEGLASVAKGSFWAYGRSEEWSEAITEAIIRSANGNFARVAVELDRDRVIAKHTWANVEAKAAWVDSFAACVGE